MATAFYQAGQFVAKVIVEIKAVVDDVGLVNRKNGVAV